MGLVRGERESVGLQGVKWSVGMWAEFDWLSGDLFVCNALKEMQGWDIICNVWEYGREIMWPVKLSYLVLGNDGGKWSDLDRRVK
jgi:hypothetical protein